jgi:diacylglycerol kinase (ATP)
LLRPLPAASRAFGQSSFFVHFFVAALVIVTATILRASFLEWCLLALCIQGVLVAEMFNSALEWLGRAITHEHNKQLGIALDIASGAVLVAAVCAALIGGAIFLHRLGVMLAWWPSLI